MMRECAPASSVPYTCLRKCLRRVRRALLPVAAVAALALGLAGRAQMEPPRGNPGMPFPGADVGHLPGGPGTSGPADRATGGPVDPIVERRLRALNQMRQKSLVNDAEKLLRLAQELNSGSGDAGPADRMRKAAEIEKLAKSIREKMAYSVANPDGFRDPNNLWPQENLKIR